MAKKKKASSKARNPKGNPTWKKGQSANPETQFQPGESGNPGGYSRAAHLRNAYQTLLGRHHKELKNSPDDTVAMRMAKRILRSAVLKGNVSAAKEATDRAEGKAPQPIDVGFGESDPLALLLEEFRHQHAKSSASET
jgi:hypothetical protein